MLAPGTQVGPYTVIGEIGAGAMGRVYRARDTKLNRDVALKVLPATVADDVDRFHRFTREAQILASLDHPNIAHVNGLEESGGVRALVMELVEGDDLSQRLNRGPLPVGEALRIARQIADALETAHRRGIIHRDLKPANIMVRPDGAVKVLDFGLAKAMETSAVTSPPTMSTVTSPALTQIGVILGTAAYMSPEQARGEAVDERADIWAYGCILFEILSGHRPFAGENVTDVLNKIAHAEPDWTRLPEALPPSIVRVIRRSLQKDVRRRWHSIADVRLELDDESIVVPQTSHVSRRRRAVLATAALAVVSVAIATFALWKSPDPPSPSGGITRLTLPLPEGQRLDVGDTRHIEISPDGRTIVYAAQGQLFRRGLSDASPVAIPGTEGSPLVPAFSRNGRWVVFVTTADGVFPIRKVPLEGGTAVTLTTAAQDLHPSFIAGESDLWWGDGRVIGVNKSGIIAISENDGTRQQLVSSDPAKEVLSSPQLIRDGKYVLFTARRLGESGPQAQALMVQGLGSTDRKVVVTGGVRGRLVAGHLMYSSGTNLVAAPFSEERLEVTGEPKVLAAGVTRKWAVSETGTVVYESAPVSSGSTLWWVSRDGREHPIEAPPLPAVSNIRLSPDGSRLAFSSGGDIWVWTIGGNTMSRLNVQAKTLEYNPAWMPDGRRVVFDSGPELVRRQILVQSADGSGSPALMSDVPGGWPNAVSPDGRFLVFHDVSWPQSLMLQPITPAGPPRSLVNGASLNAEISPDGRWIAYQASESGRWEVYVQPFPAVAGGRWQVSRDGGEQPLWSPSGSELFFITAAGLLVSADVDTRNGFVAKTPKALFSVDRFAVRPRAGAIRGYDISRDGKQFLFTRAPVFAPITLVMNWSGGD